MKQSNFYKLERSGNEVILLKYSGREECPVLPEQVTMIGDRAFYQNASIREVFVAGRVHSIGADAFGGCRNLESVCLGDGMRSLGIRCFSYCRSLHQVNFPENLETIGGRAFEYCHVLDRVRLENPGTAVGENAFRGTAYFERLNRRAERLKRGGGTGGRPSVLIIPEGITNIDMWEYSNAPIREAVLPNSLRTVGKRAFSGCASLRRISMPPLLRYNAPVGETGGGDIFYGCVSLEDVFLRGPADEEPHNLLKYFDRKRLFAGCTRMKRITAYEIPLRIFPEEWRAYAVRGYLDDDGRKRHYRPEIAAEYDRILPGIRRRLIRRTRTDSSYPFIEYLLEHEMIHPDEIDGVIENISSHAGLETMARLLQYKYEKTGKSTGHALSRDYDL